MDYTNVLTIITMFTYQRWRMVGMSDKLTFEQWKDDIDISVSPEAIESLRLYHGVDGNKEVDIMLRSMYNNYLQEDNTMT